MDVEARFFAKHAVPIMGVVNVTPDSFSDGGLYAETQAAIDHGIELWDDGAEVVDVGGESTRPGSVGVSAEEELGRVLPVLHGLLAQRPDIVVSVDTSKPEVAEKTLAAGAMLINDVTGAIQPAMNEAVAKHDAGLIIMHMRGEPRTMQKDTHYDDVVAEVTALLGQRAKVAEASGVKRQAIMVDPGIGFGKSLEGNLALLRGLTQIAQLGYPLLLGTSRKSFLGLLTGAKEKERLSATLASLVPAFMAGQVMVRVHDVLDVVRFRTVWGAVYR